MPCIRCKNPEQPMAPGRHICKACLRIDLRMGARQRKRRKALALNRSSARPVVTDVVIADAAPPAGPARTATSGRVGVPISGTKPPSE